MADDDSHDDDLKLARACAQGDERAVRLFRDRYLNDLRAIAGKVAPHAVDEVVSAVLERLLVSTAERPAQIGGYKGAGALRGWLRVVVTREALARKQGDAREAPVDDDALFERATHVDDPELQFVKERHRREFKAAFVDALGELSAKERFLLRAHYGDGRPLDEIAAVYRVHKSTAGRWLIDARQRLFDGTRARLMKLLGEGTEAFESMMGLIRSQLAAALDGAFGDEAP